MQKFNEQVIHNEFLNASFFSLPQFSMFHSVEVDSSQNYHFLKPGSGEKIQIIVRINPVGVLVGKKNEETYNVTILGDEKKLTEAILYQQGNPVGVLRQEKEQWIVKGFCDSESLFTEILVKNKETFCKGNKLYSSELSEIFSLFLADKIVNGIIGCDKQIDFTVWNSSLSGENGLFHALNTSKADKILFLSLVDGKDLTEDSGGLVVLKDGNYVLPQEQRDFAKSISENGDFYVGKTDNIIEKLALQLYDKKFLGIYIPVDQFGSTIEEISITNLKKTQDLLLKCIAQL